MHPCPTSPLTAAALRSARFTATTWREGYAPAEVDALLERVASVLEAREASRRAGTGLTADDVVGAAFSPTRFRDGYDQDEVDDLLDHVVEALRRGETAAL